jgi:DNA repair exonuclease SbcCD ATPase subunit
MCKAHYTDEHDLGNPVHIYHSALANERPRTVTQQDRDSAPLHIRRALQLNQADRKRQDSELTDTINRLRLQHDRDAKACDDRVRQAQNTATNACSESVKTAQDELQKFRDQCKSEQSTLRRQLADQQEHEHAEITTWKAQYDDRERKSKQRQSECSAREAQLIKQLQQAEQEQTETEEKLQEQKNRSDRSQRLARQAETRLKSESARLQGIIQARQAEIKSWQARATAATCDAELGELNAQLVDTLSSFSDIVPYVLQLQTYAQNTLEQGKHALTLAQTYAPEADWRDIRLDESLPPVPSAFETLLKSVGQ